MEHKENSPTRDQDDFNIEDVVNKIKEFYNLIILHFWKLFIIGLFGGFAGFYYAFQSTPIYSSNVKFIMKESAGNAGLMSSLGSLGSLLGGASGTASPMDRTLAVMGSERIVGAALLKQIIVNQKSDLAINHFIRIQELHEKWQDDSVLNGILFEKNKANLESLDFAHRKAIKQVFNILIGKKSKVIARSFDKKSGVFEQTVNISNEDFSIQFSNSLFKELEQFLYEQSVSSSSKNVTILNNKIDSIKSALNGVQNKLARSADRTLGLLMQEDKVEQKKLMMREQMLTIMYGEAQKNFETFKFMNESVNPGLELLETPFAPIKPVKRPLLIFTAIGFLFFGSLGFGFFLVRKWLQKS